MPGDPREKEPFLQTHDIQGHHMLCRAGPGHPVCLDRYLQLERKDEETGGGQAAFLRVDLGVQNKISRSISYNKTHPRNGCCLPGCKLNFKPRDRKKRL